MMNNTAKVLETKCPLHDLLPVFNNNKLNCIYLFFSAQLCLFYFCYKLELFVILCFYSYLRATDMDKWVCPLFVKENKPPKVTELTWIWQK